VVLEGIKFYGAPWIPELIDWAFFKDSASLQDAWSRVPDDADVLITHTPPYGVLDQNSRGRHCGCKSLRGRISQVRPSLHCFGHIHASAGVAHLEGTTFVNASIVDRSYKPVRGPVVLNGWQRRSA
jgi:Icc-related predicted phosphoesterase